MGFFSKLLGLDDAEPRRSPRDVLADMGAARVPDNDEQAIARYRYMLRTAPPETLEQAHAEAFAKLTPEQRRQVLAQLSDAAPPAERAAVSATSLDDPQALARVATRAEVRNPGTIERSLGGAGGLGMGSLLGSFAMGFAGSMVAQSLFSSMSAFGADEAAGSDEVAQATDEAGYDGDSGGEDLGGGDLGGDDFEI